MLLRWDPIKISLGIFAKAIKSVGLKFLVTFHHAENWFFCPHWEKDYDTSDPAYRGLYGKPHDEDKNPGRDWEKHEPPSHAFLEQWKAKIIKVIDAYQPDVMWFDYGISVLSPILIN